MGGQPFPLFERFPELAALPRARLCSLPSPVEKLGTIADDLWIKRDDLNARLCGGNKARALEFLLGGLDEGDAVVTVGGAGSTHVLATAVHAGSLGLRTIAMRWTHDMNPVSDQVSLRIAAIMAEGRVHGNPVFALASARFRALTGRMRYIPVGGSTPLGMLGHVNAALELAAQIESGDMPMPGRIVIPIGSGGTVAGMLLGFAIAGLDIAIVGARAGPRLFVNRRKVLSLTRRASSLIETVTGKRLPVVDATNLRIVHDVYGGAYGRPLSRASEAAAILSDTTGIRLDDTYSAKAWVATLDERAAAKGPLLFWLTFDASCLTN